MNTKVISLRVDEDLLLEVDKRADLCGRSRNWVVGMILGNWAKLPVAAKEIMLGSKNMAREEHVPGILEAGILAAEEFDRREEESFIARLPDVGGTPRLRRLGKAVCPGCGTLDGRHLDWCKEMPKKIATIAGGGDGEEAGEAIQEVAAGGTTEGVQPGSKGGGGTSGDRVEAILLACHNPLAAEEEKGVGGIPRLSRRGKVPDGPHILTARDGTTAFCDPQTCKFCAQGVPSNRSERQLAHVVDDFVDSSIDAMDGEQLAQFSKDRKTLMLAARIEKIAAEKPLEEIAGEYVDAMIGNLREAGKQREAKKIAAKKHVPGGGIVLKARSQGIATLAQEIANCPDCIDCKKIAYSDATTPGFFYTECEMHRKMLERVKPKSWGDSLPREELRGDLDAPPLTKQQVDSPDFGAEPGSKMADMAKLREICAGNSHANHFAHDPDAAQEVDLCGFKSYNEVDGENYICGLEKHGPKTKHGGWIKV